MHIYNVLSVPSKAPQNLTIINITSTSVTISWDSVECIHRNGLITQYLLIIRPVDTSDSNLEKFVTLNSDGPDNGGGYMATALQPSVSYMFKVAAINNNGIGPFTEVQTMKGLLNVYCVYTYTVVSRKYAHLEICW